MASNCGECPEITISNVVTCSGNYEELISTAPCSLAVKTAMCGGIVGDASIVVVVFSNVAAAGIVQYF